MAQPQQSADVRQDELCPPNKRYALMDANKKVDLDNPLCLDESRILANIFQNHPLRFSIAASSSVLWIYLRQIWDTLQEDGSKYKLKFMLDIKELTLTLDDFRTIFHLPQATNNNHDHFVPAPKFFEMVPFYINNLGFTLELRSTSNFKTTGLLQLWQTLCKMFSRCLTTRVTGYDQPSLQIMQMLYCFVNNIYVDYAELLWEGFHYSLQNPTTMIPYPKFTKLIVSHYMTAFHEILRRVRDRYHNLEDDVMIKSIFNLGKSKNVVRMKIPDWMITDEMKLTDNYRLYAEVFGVDVPTTQSQPIESTQGTHRTTSSPRTPNPEIAEGESSAPRRFTVIRLFWRSKKVVKSLKLHKNVEKVKEHLMTEEIEKLVKGSENVEENVEVAISPLRNDDNQTNLGTMLEPKSDKEIPKVEKIVDISQLVNVIEEEEESTKDDYEYKSFFDELQGKYGYLFGHLTTRFMPRRKFNELARHLQDIMMESLPKMVDERIKKILQTQVPLHVAQGIILEREKSQAEVAKMIADAIQQERENFRSEISSQVNDAITNHIPSQVDSSVRSYMSGHVLHVHPTQATPTNAQEQQHQLYLTMKDNPQLQQDDLPIWLALKYKFERLHMVTTPCRPFVVLLRDQDDPHDDAYPEGENSAKRQKITEHGTFELGGSSFGQDYESEPGPSTSGNKEQSDDFGFWTNSYAIDDDVLQNEKVSQELVDEMSQTVDETKLHKVVNEMLRQQCTSGDEHQYHIDQMQNFLKSDIVWESRKDLLQWEEPRVLQFLLKMARVSLHDYELVVQRN
ncbi:hypothetical protein Tco_0324576 [Tanacetum coccineum]